MLFVALRVCGWQVVETLEAPVDEQSYDMESTSRGCGLRSVCLIVIYSALVSLL